MDLSQEGSDYFINTFVMLMQLSIRNIHTIANLSSKIHISTVDVFSTFCELISIGRSWLNYSKKEELDKKKSSGKPYNS